MALVPNGKKRLNRCKSSRVILSGSLFAGWWREQSGLRCLGVAAGAVCHGAFAGNAFSVESRFRNQPKGLGGKSKFMLRYRQAAFGAFHGVKRSNQARGAMNGRGCPLRHGQALRF